MNARTLWALIVAAAAASCAPVGVAPPPPGSLQTARAACNEQYPARVGNFVAHTMCVNAAIDRYALPTAPHPDLVRLQEEIRISLSTKVDQRQLSPQAGEKKMKAADTLITQIEHDRQTGDHAAADRRLLRLYAMAQ
jgi:hypothetical protein